MLEEVADLDRARQAHEHLAQIPFVVPAVEEQEARHKGGGQDEDALRVAEGIADEQAR